MGCLLVQLCFGQPANVALDSIMMRSLDTIATKKITDLNIKYLKYSFGAGLRYLFNKKENVNFRMDIGIGSDGNTGIYFGIEEAF